MLKLLVFFYVFDRVMNSVFRPAWKYEVLHHCSLLLKEEDSYYGSRTGLKRNVGESLIKNILFVISQLCLTAVTFKEGFRFCRGIWDEVLELFHAMVDYNNLTYIYIGYVLGKLIFMLVGFIVLIRIWDRLASFVFKILYPASNWSCNYSVILNKRLKKKEEEVITLNKCVGAYEVPEWVREYYESAEGEFDARNYSGVIGGYRDTSKRVTIAGSISTETSDYLKTKNLITSEVTKVGKITNHVLNDVMYGETLVRLHAVDFQGYVIAEVGGHSGSIHFNSIRICDNLENGDNLRILQNSSKALHEEEKEISYRWVNKDFFDYDHRLDVVFCVFVVGIDVRKLMAHCRNLGVKHLLFVTAATSNLLDKGYMCTNASQLLTYIEGERVISKFNETEKIYNHDIADYFSPFIYDVISFSDKSYYKRDIFNNVDSNVLFCYSLMPPAKTIVDNQDITVCNGEGEDYYVMTNHSISNGNITAIPKAISKECMVQLESYCAKITGDPVRVAEVANSMAAKLCEQNKLESDGGFIGLGKILDDALAVAEDRKELRRLKNQGWSFSRLIKNTYFIGVKEYNLNLKYDEVIKNLTMKSKTLHIADEKICFHNNEIAETDDFKLINYNSVVNARNKNSKYYSWLSPNVTKKKVSLSDDPYLELMHGAGHIKELLARNELNIKKFMNTLAKNYILVVKIGEVHLTTDYGYGARIEVVYDIICNKIVKYTLLENLDSFTAIQRYIDPIDLFYFIFGKAQENNTLTQCYRYAWDLPERHGQVDTEIDFEELIGNRDLNLAALFKGRLYGFRFDAETKVILIFNNHAYKILDTKGMGVLPRRTPDALDAEEYPNGRFEMDADSIRHMRNKFRKVITKITSDGEYCDASMYKASIINWLEYENEAETQWLGKFLIYGHVGGLEKLKADSLVTVFDNIHGHVVGTSVCKIQKIGWDGKQYVNYDSQIHKFTSNEPYVFMSPDLTFTRALMIKDSIDKYQSNINNFIYSRVQFIMVDGVPGCGKTYAIAHECKVEFNEIVGMREDVVILTSSQGGKEAYQEYSWIKPDKVATYDSVVINYGKPNHMYRNVEKMYCDEALMSHFGELLLVVALIKPRKVYLYGDTKQIPFLNRVIGFTLAGSRPHHASICYMNVTHRSPVYMSTILKNFYPNIEFTNSYRDYEPKVIKIFHETVLNSSECDIILTFTQHEKTAMLNVGNKKVATVHEMQGATYNNVAIVRLVVQENNIYQSPEHIVVAITRHKRNLYYYTVDTGDMLSKLLKTGKLKTDEKDFVGITKTYNAIYIPIYETKTKLATQIEDLPGQYKVLVHENYNDVEKTVQKCDKGFYNWTPNRITIDVGIGEANSIMSQLYEPYDEIAALNMEEEAMNKIPSYMKLNLEKFGEANFKNDDRVYCEPQLKTPQYPVHRGTIGTLVTSIVKRNGNPPTLMLANAHTNYLEVAERFINVFIDKQKFDECNFDYDNNTYFRDWWHSRDTTQKAVLINQAEKYNINHNVYDGTLKPLPKPKIDNSHNKALPAPQVITSMQPADSAKFAGFMKAFIHFFKRSLKDNWHINDGLDGFTLSALANNLLAAAKKGEVRILETDISKFDKSQELGSLLVCSHLFRKFKMPEDVILEWEECHIRNMLVFKTAGISLYTEFQRRSGDIMTFVGNTIVTMMALVDAFELESAIGGIFGGDDSIVVFDSEFNVADGTERMMHVFNFVVKVEHFPKAIVFASKFLLYGYGNWILMPDLMKIVIKLGRNDVRNKDHAALYYKSFKEVNYLYTFDLLCEEMASAVVIRYRKVIGINFDQAYALCMFIKGLVLNKSRFLALYKETAENSFKQSLPMSFIDKLKRQMRYTTKYEIFEDEAEFY